jgi:YD repeat-containing protein
MTTYTYNQALGKTSECSASNILTYYHYDQVGRLRFVRDAEGNITRSFEYKYKQ